MISLLFELEGILRVEGVNISPPLPLLLKLIFQCTIASFNISVLLLCVGGAKRLVKRNPC